MRCRGDARITVILGKVHYMKLFGRSSPPPKNVLLPMAQDFCGKKKAGPSGEERRKPQYMVPVSPHCPQKIGLLTLPRTVFQGTAVSSEHTSQFLPPGNVAGLRCSPPFRGSLEQLVRPSPASSSKYTRDQFGGRFALGAKHTNIGFFPSKRSLQVL